MDRENRFDMFEESPLPQMTHGRIHMQKPDVE